MSFEIFSYYCDCLEELHTKEEKNSGICSECKCRNESELKKIAADILFYYFVFTRTFIWRKRSKKEIEVLFEFQAFCADELHNLSHIASGIHDTTFARNEIKNAVSNICIYIEQNFVTKLESWDLKESVNRFKLRINSKMNL